VRTRARTSHAVQTRAAASHSDEHADSKVVLTSSATRRNTIIKAASVAALASLPPCVVYPSGLLAEEEEIAAQVVKQASLEMKTLAEPMLSYVFQYPSNDKNGTTLKWFTSRAPERYSSAAPMSADARQRIVYEAVDFSEPLIITVSVGPVPPGLSDTPQDQWTPDQVAEAVLADKSTSRVTNGQRVALSVIEDTRKVMKNGVDYWLYEHISQGSPNMNEVLQKETYRHSFAATAKRGDYMYTLNLAAPERRWDTVEAGFKLAQESFTLATPGKDFVPPEKNPWRFW